ncbi:MAG: hypothetical protein RX316_09850 [bacterium]|nr:hypothetical protein [bacterium]
MELLDFVLKELEVISQAPTIFFAAVLLLGGVIWYIHRWYYDKQLSDKDATIGLLEQQIKFSDEAAHIQSEIEGIQPSLEAEALNLHIGKESFHQAFLKLTDEGGLTTFWNPYSEPWKWEGPDHPDVHEGEQQFVLRHFYSRGYISSPSELGAGKLLYGATDHALKIREVYNGLSPVKIEKQKEALEELKEKHGFALDGTLEITEPPTPDTEDSQSQ